jgi:hypothetical protein
MNKSLGLVSNGDDTMRSSAGMATEQDRYPANASATSQAAPVRAILDAEFAHPIISVRRSKAVSNTGAVRDARQLELFDIVGA